MCSLGGELTALPDHQEERHGKIQQRTQPDILSCRESQQAQNQGRQAHGDVVLGVVGLFSAHLEQRGGAGDHHGIGGAEYTDHQQELRDIKENDGKGVVPAAQKKRPERLDAGKCTHVCPSLCCLQKCMKLPFAVKFSLIFIIAEFGRPAQEAAGEKTSSFFQMDGSGCRYVLPAGHRCGGTA